MVPISYWNRLILPQSLNVLCESMGKNISHYSKYRKRKKSGEVSKAL